MDRILRRRILSVGGRPRKDQDWAAFWYAVVGIAQVGRLTKANFPTIEELKAEILGEINESLSDGSIKPYVSQIWRKFVDK